MKLLILLGLVFVASCYGRPKAFFPRFASNSVLTKSSGTPRIINGTEVAPHSIPYQVYLYFYDDMLQLWTCGGSLISETFVLTAGHCVYQASVVKVILGAHNLSKMEVTQQSFQSSKFYLHEKFDYNTVQNDIGLVKLPRAATLNQYVQLAVLPSIDEPSLVGVEATVSGWGLTNYNRYTVPDVLMAVSVNIVDNDQCMIYREYNSDMTICTKGETSQGSCEGDSGGPLTANGKVVGVVSYGPEKCQNSIYPDGFTRVTTYLPWIANVTTLVIPAEHSDTNSSTGKVKMVGSNKLLWMVCAIMHLLFILTAV